VSIKALYILLVVGIVLVLWAAVAAFLRVRRHMRASADHGLREIQGEQKTGKE
jgi:hypothetical protein